MAYFQPFIDPDVCGESCAVYLRTQLLFVFASYVAFDIIDVCVPLIKLKVSLWWEARQARLHGHEAFAVSLLEQQAMMNEFTGADEQDAYLGIILPLSYLLMFGTFLPSMSVLAYLSFCVQLRLHAWKFSSILRRTFPVHAKGIGTWNNILPWLVTVANFNCIGMMIVSVSRVGQLVPFFARLTTALDIPIEGKAAKLLLFFILQNLAFAWFRLIDIVVDDIPKQTRLETARQHLQRERLTKHAKAEFHENVELSGSVDVDQSAFHDIAPLQEGHELYTAPLVHV